MENDQARENYTEWQITHDGSLIAGHYPVRAMPPKPFLGPGFNFRAAELVSPPFPAGETKRGITDESFQEIKTCLQVVKGYPDNSIGAFVDGRCGFHIHVGSSQSDTREGPFPIRVLQHFAMILVHFEKAINKLHAFTRTDCPTSQAGRYAKTNLVAFLADRHSCNDPRFPDARKEAPRLIFAPNMTIEVLACMMGGADPLDSYTRSFLLGLWQPNSNPTREDWETLPLPYIDKYKVVRWELLIQHERPKTLEFRQAQGTLDETRVKALVNFYVYLMRHAERLAYNYPSDQKCVDFWEPIMNKVLDRLVKTPSLKELCEFLELEAPDAEYLQRGVRDYAHDSWNWCAKADNCHMCRNIACKKKETRQDKHSRQSMNAVNKCLGVKDFSERQDFEFNRSYCEWVASQVRYIPQCLAWKPRNSEGYSDEGEMPPGGW